VRYEEVVPVAEGWRKKLSSRVGHLGFASIHLLGGNAAKE
jgi:hypothetical protein